MKNKNILTLGTIAATMAIALTSCGGGAGGSGEVDRTLPTDDPTSTVQIRFWHCLGHDKLENLKQIVSAFNTKYAGKYEVKLEQFAGDYDSLFSAVKTKLAEGSVPALCMGYPDAFSTYMTKSLDRSNILRLDNFINDSTYGYTAAEKADFVDEYYNEGAQYLFNGTWSFPMYKSTEVMYYNANYFVGENAQTEKVLGTDATYNDLINDLGKKPTDAQLAACREYVSAHGGYVYDVPVTWTDMITVSRKMIADRAAQNITDTFYPFGYDSDANLMISQMAQRGIPYTVNDEASQQDPTKHFVFNNQSAKDLVQEIVNLIREKVMITKGSLGGTTYTNTYFNEGKLAMTVGSTGGSSYNVSENFGVRLAPVPYSNNTQKYIMQGPSICFFNNDNDYIHKGAWLFYKEMSETENNAALSLENSYDPVKKSCYETTTYTNWIANAGQGVLKYDIPAITSTLKSYYMTSPCFVGSSEARTRIGEIISSVILTSSSIDDAFTYAINKCNSAARD